MLFILSCFFLCLPVLSVAVFEFVCLYGECSSFFASRLYLTVRAWAERRVQLTQHIECRTLLLSGLVYELELRGKRSLDRRGGDRVFYCIALYGVFREVK